MARDGLPSELDYQLEQEDSGEPIKAAYDNTIYNYYWGFLDGNFIIMARRASSVHPANNLWDVRNNPPAGYEPIGPEMYDPFNK